MSDQNEFGDSGALAFALADETTPGETAAEQPLTDETPVPEGTVLVVARRGYKFVLPGKGDDDDLVVDDKEPLRVPEEHLDQLMKISNGRLRVVDETKEG